MRYRCSLLLTVCAVALLAGCNGREPERHQPPDSQAATTEPAPVDTPERLLRRILTLASNKRYDEIGEHILPLRLPGAGGPEAVPREVRAEILAAMRDPGATGEFAYSHRALLAVVTHHLDRFGPVPAAMLEAWAVGKEWGTDVALQDTASRRPDDLQCFRHAGAFILLEKKGGQFYLRYWSNLSKVLGEAATRRADQFGYVDLKPLTVTLKDRRIARVGLSLVVRAEKAEKIGRLAKTREFEATDWLVMYLSGLKASEFDAHNLPRLCEGIRKGLQQVLGLSAEDRIVRVMMRELG